MKQQTATKKMMRLFLLKQRKLHLFLLISMTQVTFSQPMLQRIVISSGGVVQSSSNTALSGTIGQTIIGIGKDNTSEARFGFWYPDPNLQTTDVPYRNERTNHAATLAVYPNPVQLTGVIAITLPHAGMARLSLVDLLGREQSVLCDRYLEAGTQLFDIDLSKKADGLYFTKLQFGQATTVHTIQVLR